MSGTEDEQCVTVTIKSATILKSCGKLLRKKKIAQYLIAILQYFSVLHTNSGADLNQNNFVLRRLGCKMLTEI